MINVNGTGLARTGIRRAEIRTSARSMKEWTIFVAAPMSGFDRIAFV